MDALVTKHAALLRQLAGSWEMVRDIEPEGSFVGTATFSPRGDGWLAYREAGRLHLPAGTFAAERRYLFEPRGDGFAVWFDEAPPRLFHEIVLAGQDGILTGEAAHPCRADTYMTSYRFAPDGTFAIRHCVTGPTKDYTMTTHYTRTSGQEIAAPGIAA